MLEELFEKAQRLRLKLEGFRELSKSEELKELFEKARHHWNKYKPERGDAKILAIDSGWNHRLFSGFYIYAIKSTAVDESENTYNPMTEVDIISGDPYNVGLLPDNFLKFRAEMYEHEIAYNVSKDVDLVLIDGSLIARLVDISNRASQRLLTEYMSYVKPLKGNRKLVFISKSSHDRSLLEGPLGDIYYINQATDEIGYTAPHVVTKNGIDFSIFYVRLSEHANVLHVEVPAVVDESYIEHLIDMLHETTIAGYPFVLRVAHKVANFPDTLMESICKVVGLTGWIEAREVLEA